MKIVLGQVAFSFGEDVDKELWDKGWTVGLFFQLIFRGYVFGGSKYFTVLKYSKHLPD